MTNSTTSDVSFQYMINGSRAVLTRPSVATFEEYERNNLNWALIYVAIGAVIAGILGAISFVINPPVVTPPADLPPELAQAFEEAAANAANASPIGLAVQNLFGALLGFIIFTALVYALGRAFGGTGNFGELAFDLSLPYTPLAVFTALVNVIAIGPLAILTGLVAFAASLYQIYLSYLAIQSGMNLPKDKALYVMLILIGIALLIGCGIAMLVALGIAAMGGFAP